LTSARDEHRAFLNRYYGISRFFYDATRKYYLFGRDTTLRDLAADSSWQRLIEIGPGTGRNLVQLSRARPDAQLGGIEASDAMLAHARKRCPWAKLEHGFAESAPLGELLGGRPDRVLFSYCLSMVGDRAAALANARSALAPHGEVVVVDFADFGGLPSGAARAFRDYLRAFHVEPLDDKVLAGAKSLRFGPRRYYVIARFSA
jgi:S-adenosylmethionine-diacylgycerolhomoserine-N-methlytransferase